ncbi:unnamed protein product [Vicia faba]|uniref:Alpha/beta hydrolase fold-3 domain-containing protein n=1 Tax=Vicia faba TaxID=3906 RepID=A0AAV1AEW9_VICFA|nr:unnamed protein product [Vicia faba]
MPSVAVKLYSIFFKFLLKHRLQNRIQAQPDNNSNSFGITSRPEESVANSNPSFTDDVATKDIHIDPFTSLSIRIFLPHSALSPPEPHSKPNSKPKQQALEPGYVRRSSYGPPFREEKLRGRNSNAVEGLNLMGAGVETGAGLYRGYSLALDNRRRKLPVMLQFHGGGWVSGSNDSVANDLFCRRIAKLCDVIVVAVGYRLAPESRYPAAFEDGLKVLNWLAKQENLAECSKSMGVGGGSHGGGGGGEFNKDNHRHIVDSFGASVVEPWLASHGDPTSGLLSSDTLYCHSLAEPASGQLGQLPRLGRLESLSWNLSLNTMNKTTTLSLFTASNELEEAHAIFPLLACSLWMSFGVYVTGVLFQTAAFVSFLLISHGYCIMCEHLSLNERRSTAALACVFYLTLVGYKASVPYFTVSFLDGRYNMQSD